MVLILRFLRKMSGVGLNSEVVIIVGTSMHYTPMNTSISIHPSVFFFNHHKKIC